MGRISLSDIKHVAILAKLDLSEKELKKYFEQLSSAIDYISQLNEVDTGGVTPTSQTTGLTNVLREDKLKTAATLKQGRALSGTNKTHNGYFVVPGIFGEKSIK